MPRTPRLPLALGALCLLATACAAPAVDTATPSDRSWEEVLAAAEGQTVGVWMWGGDERGNAYVDDVLAPAAAELGVTLRRVPVTDTKDALRRVLAERAAGEEDGTVDLVWVNGDNFATGREAGADALADVAGDVGGDLVRLGGVILEQKVEQHWFLRTN